MKNSIESRYKTTDLLLKRARADADPVSCFANGTQWADVQEAIFVVKGKRKVLLAFSTLVAAGLLTSNPIVEQFNKN